MRIETDLDGAVVSAIERHYNHAKEKHPYFCDRILPTEAYRPTKDDALKELQSALLDLRQRLNDAAQEGECSAYALARCEMYEAQEAYACGDNAHAVEECYDAIAVLLRMIDVLEGRQSLGKPKEGAK